MVLTKTQALLILAFFVLGILIGMTGSILYSGWMIDQAVIELETLYSELGERDNRISRLEDSLQERRYRIVKGVNIELDVKDRHLNLRMANEIRSLVDDLIGRELESLDPKLIFSILDGRVIYVVDQPYTLSLRYLVVNDIISLNLQTVAGTTRILD